METIDPMDEIDYRLRFLHRWKKMIDQEIRRALREKKRIKSLTDR